MVCKKASPLLNVNTLVGNDRTDPIFIYQTWIFCKKNGSNRSFLPEIGAQTFCYIPGGVATAYSTDKNPNVNKLSRAINYKTPHLHGDSLQKSLLNHLLWNPSSILLKLFLTLVSIQEESKALTIKEKLKRKMQQQLKKTFKVSGMDLLQNQPLFNIDFIHRRIRRLRRSA